MTSRREPGRGAFRPACRAVIVRTGAWVALLTTLVWLPSCGRVHEPYVPQRPTMDAPVGNLQAAEEPGWFPGQGLLEMAARRPPTALAQIDHIFTRIAQQQVAVPGWDELELMRELATIQAELDRLRLGGGSVLRQRMGTLSDEEAALFRQAAALETRWGLALMQTGEVNDRVAGAERLRQALEWDPGNPVLILLLSGYYDLAGFVSTGTGLLEDYLREYGHHDLIVLQLMRRQARNWVVTREPAQLDSALALCDELARHNGCWQGAPAWLCLELARLHYLADATDSVRVAAENAIRRGRDLDSDPEAVALGHLLIGVCDVRELEFEKAHQHFGAAMTWAAQEPTLRDLVAWMVVPWDLWTEEDRLRFDRSSDRLAFIEDFWASDDPIEATPRLQEHRIEYRRRVAESYLTLTGVDPAVPGPLSQPGRAILRFGWPLAWISEAGQLKEAAKDNSSILAGVDRSWRLAYNMPDLFGARPDTILFQDGGSGSRFLPVDSLASPHYPLFAFDLGFGGRSYPFHARTARFRNPDRGLALAVCFDTYVPDYTVSYPLSGLQFDGSIDMRAALYRSTERGRTLDREFSVVLDHETLLTDRHRLLRRSGTHCLEGVDAGVFRLATQGLMRDAEGRLLAMGVDNGQPRPAENCANDSLALSDLLPIESFEGVPPAETLRRMGPSVVAYGNHLREEGLVGRACPLYLAQENFTFYIEAYNLRRRNGRTLAELAMALERLDPEGELEFSIEISGRDQVLQQADVNEWHILRSIGLSNLEPGPYRVRATVTDHQADTRRERVVEFEVVQPGDLVDFYGWQNLQLPGRLLSSAQPSPEQNP